MDENHHFFNTYKTNKLRKMKKLLVTLMLAAPGLTQAQVTINIDANQRGPEISPTHYGIFYEDINHAADGGLYAELIRNRSFEDDFMERPRRRRRPENAENRTTAERVLIDNISAWHKVGTAALTLTKENPLNEAQQYSMNLKTLKPGDGMRNEGFWGINAVKGTSYQLSFWAKSDSKFAGTLTAKLQSKDGNQLGLAEVKVKLTKKWQKFTATITATGDDSKAEFVLTSDKAGELQLDVISLFPPTFKDRPNGMRKDLAEMLLAMKPSFMRFPGGCFVEGQNSPDNAFRWKRTIGPIEQRPGHPNVNWGYRTSDGIGFHEYLQLAEDLGAKPLFVVNVGIWHGGCDPYDKIDSWIQECLDALEYANGPVTSKYGKMRAENGHPAPFNLEFIEIGNENYNFHMDNNTDQSDHYPERYIQFYNAIKAKYPNVKCIGNVESWGTDEPTWRNSHPVDLVDEHYYRNPKWFADRFLKYNSYPRNSHKVYVGEYAVTSMFGDIGNLNAALGEAVYMMGMENNSDVVAMNSYAPIFVNENDARWRPDMIRFNSSKCMGTPSYYVQQLFPNNIGKQVVITSWNTDLETNEHQEDDGVKPFQVGLASWSTTAEYRNATLTVDGKEYQLPGFDKWNTQSGEWKSDGSSVTQTSNAQAAILLAPEKLTSRNYTYKVQARKTRGLEGFMLMFDYFDRDNYSWFNIGGWSNTQNNVEQGMGGGRVQLAKDSKFKVEDDRWYDLQVDVRGDSVYCYIDGKLDSSCVKQKGGNMEGVYASTTIDDGAKMMYVKVVNVGEGHAPGLINLQNCSVNTDSEQSVEIIRLASANGTDENTLDSPKAIYPRKAAVIVPQPQTIVFEVPPFSVNIIRIKLK